MLQTDRELHSVGESSQSNKVESQDGAAHVIFTKDLI